MGVKVVRVTKHPLPQPVIRLVQGDANTQVLRFLVKKQFGGKDLSGLVWSVWVQGHDGEAEVSYIGLGTVSGDDIVLNWNVISSATKAPGFTVIKLYGSNDGDGETHNAWVSGNMIINVTPTQLIDPYDSEEVEDIRQLVEEFSDIEDSIKSYSENAIDEQKDYIDEKLLAESTLRSNAIGTLTTRIDNIFNIAGETGKLDTELLNIRVGADGTQYSSAGTAVRSQISSLKEAIDSANDAIEDANEAIEAANEDIRDNAQAGSDTIENVCGESDNWSNSETYNAGTVIIHDSILWRAKMTSTGVEPDEGNYWERVSLSSIAEDMYSAPFVQIGKAGGSPYPSVGANQTTDWSIPFPKSFSDIPVVVCSIITSTSAATFAGVSLQVVDGGVFNDKFTLRFNNNTSNARTPYINWIAVGKR